MQFVFLYANPGVQLIASYDVLAGEWLFRVPGTFAVIHMEEALLYLSNRRRYPSRRQPTVKALYTQEMIEGEWKVIPWTTFLERQEIVNQQLMQLHECFCCCESFPTMFDVKDVTKDEVALVKSSCGDVDHACCTHCLRTILLNFYSHPVTKASPQLKCFFPDCGSHQVFNVNHFKNLFTSTEFEQLNDHIRKMNVPDTLSVLCYKCEEPIVAPMEPKYKNRDQVHLGCKESGCLGESTCWHCMEQSSTCFCDAITSYNLGLSYGTWNPYYRPIQRNYELTRDTILENIKQIIDHPTLPMAMRCPKCDAWVQKSVACNEMSVSNFFLLKKKKKIEQKKLTFVSYTALWCKMVCKLLWNIQYICFFFLFCFF